MAGSAPTNVVAFVGATGGAGTTRTALEVAATLAADGRDVAVFDAAFATQGLADYVDGRIDPDLTALLTDAADAPLSRGITDLDLDLDRSSPGRVAVCPAHAPFERLARAKSVEAARRLESRIATAAAQFDAVLVDVPPIAANQAVAAVNAADRVALVAPATERGAAGLQRATDRVADVGGDVSLVVSTRGSLETADVAVPDGDAGDPRNAPSSPTDDGAFAAAIERVAAAVTGRDLTDADDEATSLLDRVGEYVR
ncbi:MAG: AAA family ATPase [Haloquadratum sp.]